MDASQFEEECLLLAVALDDDEETERKDRRRLWVHGINISREGKGEFNNLYHQLREDEERFYTAFRMNCECFDELLGRIKDDITKLNTNYRCSIDPVQRLAVALRFLATGDHFKTIGNSYHMGYSTVSAIVTEVCKAIWERLQPVYLPQPTHDIWEENTKGFYEKWQFPNCIGSIDGKHVQIKRPPKSGSTYYNYLGTFSVVLLAIADHDCKFTCIDVGGYGKNSDGGIFEASSIGKRIDRGMLNVPENRQLHGQNEPTPCVLIGDEAFPLRPYLMRPFPCRCSRNDEMKEKYNKGLCRARRTVKNAFGILVQKWRVFLRPLEVKVETAKLIIKTACVLHNYIKSKNCNENFECLLEPVNFPVGAFQNQNLHPRRPTNFAFEIRERFVAFFNSD